MVSRSDANKAGCHETDKSDRKKENRSNTRGASSDEEDHLNEQEQQKEKEEQEVRNEAPKKQSRGKKRGASSKQFRKAPGAPKRFKSSYIFFFTDCQAKLKKELGQNASIADVSRRSATIWRNLSAKERAHWDEVADQDKERYLAQKEAYTGPWQVPLQRTKKNPDAPKRPMS
jgi:hypothetical protein